MTTAVLAGQDTTLRSPLSRRPLTQDSPHSLAGEGERWPVIDDIPFLRAGRDDLVRETLRLLDRDRHGDAAALLLGDQDDWARSPPAPLEDRRALLRDASRINFRDAMDHLAFGPVGAYFAHRWSDPTFLSGLALAEAHWTRPARILELACGTGHFLREFARTGAETTGADVVWAKLWLARHYVAPTVNLLCFDAAHPWPLTDKSADLAFCHDAFYFLPNKPRVAAELRRISSSVLVGHAHNALVDNLSSGAPLAPAEYAALFDAPLLYDDAELTRALIEARAPVPSADLATAAAISIASAAGTPKPLVGGLTMPPRGTPLQRNPLYVDGTIAWPSPRYETEYGNLVSYPLHATGPLTAIAGDPVIDDLARRRVLLDLPKRW